MAGVLGGVLMREGDERHTRKWVGTIDMAMCELSYALKSSSVVRFTVTPEKKPKGLVEWFPFRIDVYRRF